MTVDPERWRAIQAAFEHAVELELGDLAPYLVKLRSRDPELAAEVLRLLRADERTGGLLDGLALDALELRDTGPDDASAEGALDEGRRIGAYRLVRLLGAGGMGAVWLAERADEVYRGLVAIKVVRAGLEAEEVLRRFESERQILAALQHPNIAGLLDGGTTPDGLPYLVMELVEGEPIDAHCDRERLGVAERIALFRKVCEAVRYAHRRLVVHRDIKPSNVLVDGDGTPKLLDFGIAKILDPGQVGLSEAYTRSGARLLTPRYASPEQIRGEPISLASDVYSLGVLLYRLLTGCLPYDLEDASEAEVERAILEEEPIRPSLALARREEGEAAAIAESRGTTPDRLRRRLDGDLDTILLAALRKDPERRYGSVEALSRDLDRLGRGLPVEVRPDTWGYRTAKFLRRNRVGVAVVAAFVVLLAGFAVAMAVQAARVARERDVAERERAKAEQVAEFLVGVFEASDPNETKGVEVTAGEILSRGGRRVQTELEDQPAVRAAVMDAIGRVYRTLGEYDSASVFLETALDLRARSLGEEHPDYFRSLTLLGELARLRGDVDEAIALYSEALERRRARYGTWHEEVALSLSNLGVAMHDAGDLVAAESLHAQSVAMRRDLLAPDDEDLATSLSNLAIVLDDKGLRDSAIVLYEEVLDIRRATIGEEHLDYAIALNNLATAHENAGHYEEAEALYRRSLEIRRQLLDDRHPSVLVVRNNLAKLLIQTGGPAEAERILRDVIAIRRERPEERMALAVPLNNLGVSLNRQGRHAAAAAAFRETLELVEGQYGPSHPALAYPLSGLATALSSGGEQGRAEEAYRRALEIRRASFEAPNPLIATSLDALGTFYVERGLPSDAEPLLVEALEMRRGLLDPDHPEIASSLLALGELHLVEEDPAAAEPLLREGLAIREAKLDPESVGVARARGLLGRCLARQGDDGEAEPLLVRSYETLSVHLGAAHPDTREAADLLRALYERRGDGERAARYREAATGG